MVATDTFYRAYANISHPYDFRTVRLCYAGAEAVKNDTRNLIAERLGVRLMEGYGTTECSPIVCVNNMLFNKCGTLGKLPPAMQYKLEPVPGIKQGGELCVKGPNIMKGYIYADNPGVLVPVQDGWYHTGEVVIIDDSSTYFDNVEEPKDEQLSHRLDQCNKFTGLEIFINPDEKLNERVIDFSFQTDKVYYTALVRENDEYICKNYIEPSDKHKDNYNKLLNILGLNVIEEKTNETNE